MPTREPSAAEPSTSKRSHITDALVETHAAASTREEVAQSKQVLEKKRSRARASEAPGLVEEAHRLNALDSYFEAKKEQYAYYKRREQEAEEQLKDLERVRDERAKLGDVDVRPEERVRKSELHAQLAHALKRQSQFELDEEQYAKLNEGRPEKKQLASMRGAVTEVAPGRSVKAATESYLGEKLDRTKEGEHVPSLLERKLVSYFVEDKTPSEVSRWFESAEYKKMRKELDEALEKEYDGPGGKKCRITFPKKYAVEIEFARIVHHETPETRRKSFLGLIRNIPSAATGVTDVDLNNLHPLDIYDLDEINRDMKHYGNKYKMRRVAFEDLANDENIDNATREAAWGAMRYVGGENAFDANPQHEMLKQSLNKIRTRYLPYVNILQALHDTTVGCYIYNDFSLAPNSFIIRPDDPMEEFRGVKKRTDGLYELTAKDPQSRQLNEISALMYEQAMKEKGEIERRQAEEERVKKEEETAFAEAESVFEKYETQRFHLITSLESRLSQAQEQLKQKVHEHTLLVNYMRVAELKRDALTHVPIGGGDMGGAIERVQAQLDDWRTIFGTRRKAERRLTRLKYVLHMLDEGFAPSVAHAPQGFDIAQLNESKAINKLQKSIDKTEAEMNRILDSGSHLLEEYQTAYEKLEHAYAKLTPEVRELLLKKGKTKSLTYYMPERVGDIVVKTFSAGDVDLYMKHVYRAPKDEEEPDYEMPYRFVDEAIAVMSPKKGNEPKQLKA